MALDRLKKWLKGEETAAGKDAGAAGSAYETASAMSANQLIDRFLQESGPGLVRTYDIKVNAYEVGREILAARRELQLAVVLGCAERLKASSSNRYEHVQLKALLAALLRRNLPFDQHSVEQLTQSIASSRFRSTWDLPIGSVLRVVESHIAQHGLSQSLEKNLRSLKSSFNTRADYSEDRKIGKRLEAILEAGGEKNKAVKLDSGEPWTIALQEQLSQLDEPAEECWNRLLAHCATATSSKPSKKWQKQAAELIEPIRGTFREVIAPPLEAIGKPGSTQTVRSGGYTYETDPTQIHDAHADLLRGLVWSTALVDDETLISSVGNAAENCFKKLPGVGPRSPKIGNACLHALSRMNNLSAVAQLSRLKTRAKHASVRNQLAKALQQAAASAGMTEADLEEIAVPTFGLTEVGCYCETLGDFTAKLSILPCGKTQLVWTKPDGKIQKSVPAAVKETCGEHIKQIKKTAKDIEKMLPSQRDRLEQLFLAQRQWKLPEFRERFIDHPLVGALARRLIWRFESDTEQADAIWHDERLTDSNNRILGWLDDSTQVTLWHPMHSDPVQVVAWRRWLEEHEICQPFKQAHREIYVVTDAERNTDTYSNRFAAHVLRQHQFAALCQQRGWRYSLQGAWDSANTPYIDLSNWDIRVEFWVESLGEEVGVDTSEAGIFLYLATDQVRFYNLRQSGPLSIVEVPPLLFSEMMRDVDLFVGVCSVGNDPTWSDGGPEGHFRGYWEGYAFGELTQSAQTRREVLSRLIPRLKIASQCEFSDRYLVVRGHLRTYKIHLGSGNILMSPNDEYLCIVARQGRESKHGEVFLPFEGDNTLSIILSKAFMLAEDTKIKDVSIVNQIRR